MRAVYPSCSASSSVCPLDQRPSPPSPVHNTASTSALPAEPTLRRRHLLCRRRHLRGCRLLELIVCGRRFRATKAGAPLTSWKYLLQTYHQPFTISNLSPTIPISQLVKGATFQFSRFILHARGVDLPDAAMTGLHERDAACPRRGIGVGVEGRCHSSACVLFGVASNGQQCDE